MFGPDRVELRHMSADISGRDSPSDIEQLVTDILGLEHLDAVGKSKKLGDHLVIPGPFDVEDHAAILLRPHPLPRMEGLLDRPASPGGINPETIPPRWLIGTVDRDAIGQERFDRGLLSCKGP